MAHVILMPKAGQSMTEGRVVDWIKNEGDSVERGEPLLEIETDKANLEVEALESGILRKIFVPAGESCIVLAAVGVIGSADEEIDFEAVETETLEAAKAQAEADAAPAPPKAKGPKAKDGAGASAKARPRTPSRRPAPRAPSPQSAAPAPAPLSQVAAPVGHAPAMASTFVPPAPDDVHGRRVAASPLARKLAEERGISLRSVVGTGPSGRILRRDVEAAPATPQNGGHAPVSAAAPLASLAKPYPPPAEPPPPSVPLEGMRRAIASALQQSKSTIPHFYTTMAIDVTNALALKNSYAQAGLKLTVNDLVVRATALALADEPRVNCRVFDQHIEYPDDINIGVAVGSDDGLVVPVLLRAQEHDLQSLAAEARQIVTQAQSGKLVGSGQGTFTISNLGMFGVESFTAIINPPEGAILAVGGTTNELVPSGGGFFPRSILRVTLSCDHRAIDGLLAARFLSRLRYFLETASL